MSDDATPPRRRAGGCMLFLLFIFIVVVVTAVTLQAMNLVRPYYMPMSAMAPAISNGDHVMMEGFTYRSRKPQRGDVVVFKMDKPVQALQEGVYIMRIVGLPGEKLQLTDELLKINDEPVVMHNIAGKIHYSPLEEAIYLTPGHDTVLVPPGSYFFMGDNTNASADSRFWGVLPAANIIGKISFCFWPANRAGLVK